MMGTISSRMAITLFLEESKITCFTVFNPSMISGLYLAIKACTCSLVTPTRLSAAAFTFSQTLFKSATTSTPFSVIFTQIFFDPSTMISLNLFKSALALTKAAADLNKFKEIIVEGSKKIWVKMTEKGVEVLADLNKVWEKVKAAADNLVGVTKEQVH